MKIIDRYVLSIFFSFFFGAITLLVTLFTLILFFELIADFISSKAPLYLMAAYLLNKLPEAAYYMAPMAVLAASILSLSLMSKDREVMILMSCGISALRITLPLIGGAMLIATFAFLDSEYLMPHAWIKSEDIYRSDVKKMEGLGHIRQNMVWIKTGEDIWNIGYLDVKNGILHDVNIMRFRPDKSGFASIISARKGYRRGAQWTFEEGIERRFTNGIGVEESPFTARNYSFALDFKELKHAEKAPQEMNFREITSYIEHIKRAGYEDIRYSVDRYVKITFPLISVVMAIISIPFGLKTGRSVGAFSGIAIAVMIGFVFWFLFSMGVSLGHSGKLPPLAAAGGAHLVFLGAGVYAMLSGFHAREGIFR